MKHEIGSVSRVPEARLKTERISLAVATTGLVIMAFDRLGSRGDREGTSVTLNAVDFVAEIVLIVVFAALVFRALSRPVRVPASRAIWIWISVGIIGTLASIALLICRVEGALARSPTRLRKAQTEVQTAARLTARINGLLEVYNSDAVKVTTTRAHRVFSGEAGPDEPLTREHLREHQEAVRRMVDSSDDLINACKLAEARKLDPAALGADVSLITNTYVVLQRGVRAVLAKSILIDQHWDEWQSRGLRPENGSYAPWQEELLRLEDERKTVQKDLAVAREKLVQAGLRK